jgi:endonuclease G, mitochondrial
MVFELRFRSAWHTCCRLVRTAHWRPRVAPALIAAFASLLVASGAFAAFEGCEEYVALGTPGNWGEPLCRTGYALAHDDQKKTPVWVAEKLTREKAMATAQRKNLFAPDPDLPRDKRAELRDYSGSGFDRGHMAPNADFNWDADAARQSFYLSNMVPQVGEGMNRGIWKNLEAAVRLWAVRRGVVYVYTGPIYEAKYRSVGRGKVAVPTALYKIVYDPNTTESITFVMPNQRLKVQDLAKYVTTIDEVEHRTGLTFLSQLPREQQEVVKHSKAAVTWQ